MESGEKMTVYEEKEAFVRESLSVVLAYICSSFVDVKYKAESGREIVTVSFNNGYRRNINVTGDSLRSLAIDVLRYLE